jgi:hypothetical protein
MTVTIPEPRLSDYILAGMKLTRPAKKAFFSAEEPGVMRACAIGAACYAREEGQIEFPEDFGFEQAEMYFPELLKWVEWVRPGYSERFWRLEVLIEYLNDHEGWRRDRIAHLVKKLGY